MLRALLERGILPDLVLGTSVGAINGAAVAADPTVGGVERLADLWRDIGSGEIFGGSVLRRARTLARTRTHLHRSDALRARLCAALGASAGSRISRSRFSAWRRASSAPRSTGSPTGRSSTPSSRRPPCPASCRPSRSAASTSSTEASSTASP